jgi:two-component system LytT family response regulator
MITAVLIDDETNLRIGMRAMLTRYAPEISIVGEADSVATGVTLLMQALPQVVFLDIHLGDGSGFDLLEEINKKMKLQSQVVFITAHEQYAIKAFRFSALDYLLKPVDPDDLQKVVAKIKLVVGNENGAEHIDLLLDNIRKKVDPFKKIALSTSEGVHLFEVKDIIRCESESNYTKFFIKNSKPVLISKTLKEYEEMLSEHGFERIHQSHLINMAHLKTYVKKDGGYMLMSDDAKVPIAQRKRERLQEIMNKQMET